MQKAHKAVRTGQYLRPLHRRIVHSMEIRVHSRLILARYKGCTNARCRRSGGTVFEGGPFLRGDHPRRDRCPPLKLSPRTRDPRTSCPPGQLVLGPHVPLGQLVLGPCVPLRTSCPPMSQRLLSTWTILCSRSVHQNYPFCTSALMD